MKYFLAAAFICGSNHLGQCSIYEDWGSLDQVVAQTNEIKQTSPTLPPEQKQQADAQVAQNLDKMDVIGDKHPQSVEAQSKVAQAFLQVGEPRRALVRAENALALAPKDDAVYALRGRINHQLGRYDEAARDAAQALRLNPRNAEALGLYKLSTGRGSASARRESAAAEKKGSRAAYFSSDHSEAKYRHNADQLRARALAKEAAGKTALGDAAAALRLLDKSLALNPENAKAYAARARARLALRDWTGAVSDAEEALRREPALAEAFWARAAARENRGYSQEDILADYKAAGENDGQFKAFYEQALRRYAAQSGPAGADGGGRAAGVGVQAAAGFLGWPAAGARRWLWLLILLAIAAAFVFRRRRI